MSSARNFAWSLNECTFISCCVTAIMQQNIRLSLNRTDFFDVENDATSELSSFGVTNGDIIYVTMTGGESVNVQQKNVVRSSTSTTPKVQTFTPTNDRPSTSLSSSQTNELLKNTLSKNITSNKVENELESLVVLIHTLLLGQGFREKTNGESLPDDWKLYPPGRSGPRIFSLTYVHPLSGVLTDVTIIGHTSGGNYDHINVNGTCKVGDNWKEIKYDVRLGERCKCPFSSTNVLGHFVNLDALIDEIQKCFVDKVKIIAVGYLDSKLLQLPGDIVEKIVRPLRVKSFKQLTETCHKMRELWTNENIWKTFLRRDFGVDAVDRATSSGTTYKQEYETRYKRRKELEQRERQIFYDDPLIDPFGPNPTPPQNDPWNPPPHQPVFPGIGGPDDMWPLPRPGAPQNPFGMQPHIRPRLPFDPFPSRGPRPRGPNPYGPQFPGGGGFI